MSIEDFYKWGKIILLTFLVFVAAGCYYGLDQSLSVTLDVIYTGCWTVAGFVGSNLITGNIKL